MKRIKNVLIFFLAMVMLGACRDKKSEKKEEENIQQENTFVNPLKTEGAQCWANYYDGWYYYMQEAVDRLGLWRTRDITDLQMYFLAVYSPPLFFQTFYPGKLLALP